MKRSPIMVMYDVTQMYIGFVELCRRLSALERISLFLWAIASVITLFSGLVIIINYINELTESMTSTSAFSVLMLSLRLLTLLVSVSICLGFIWFAINKIFLLARRGQIRIIQEYASSIGRAQEIDNEFISRLIKHKLSKRYRWSRTPIQQRRCYTDWDRGIHRRQYDYMKLIRFWIS